jgi:hypothetical protein
MTLCAIHMPQGHPAAMNRDTVEALAAGSGHIAHGQGSGKNRDSTTHPQSSVS